MTPLSHHPPAIEVLNLSKSFNAGKVSVLSGVNLTIPSGKITFLLGPSGGGKSILLKHLVGLLQPDQGEVRIYGESLPYNNPKKLNQIRLQFGVLFQGSALFDDQTVFNNVSFPLLSRRRTMSREEVKKLVSETLQSVGLEPSHNLDKFPNQLSGGMQKRVGLARAIILKPKIVFYDEPTSGLDPINQLTVEEMISSTHSKFGLTIFVISHDIQSALILSDYISFLYEGKIIFSGSPMEFESSNHPIIQKFLSAERRHRRDQDHES